MNRSIRFTLPLLLACFCGLGADVPAQGPQTQPAQAPADYALGPGDVLSIIVTDLPDDFSAENRNFRIDTSGDVTIPYAGRVHAAGLSTDALAKEIAAGLAKIIKQPQVVVGVAEFHSQPVSILGEVTNAGVHQVAGQKTLLQVLALGGGFTDTVGNTLTLTRSLKYGAIPLPDAHNDPSGQYSIASLNLRDLIAGKNPNDNIAIMPDDVISVAREEVVYAVGSVNRPGGFPLGQDDSLTALQVISLAQGLSRTAAPAHAMILRAVSGSKERKEIPVDVKRLMAGTGNDIQLKANDILFIPNSAPKSAGFRTIDAIVNAATGMAIYGRY